MTETALSNIKIFFDETGKAQEVLMSYETFLRLEVFLKELKNNDQSYFTAKEWQKRIREAEADIESGRTYRVQAQNIEKALEWLDE
jgi:hypothetical protein